MSLIITNGLGKSTSVTSTVEVLKVVKSLTAQVKKKTVIKAKVKK